MSRTIEKEGRQLTVEQSTDASFTGTPLDWANLDWPNLRQTVRRLQMRIAKAAQAQESTAKRKLCNGS